MEIQCKGKCNTLTVLIASKSIFSPFFFLSLPFDLKKFKSLDFFNFLFPFPPLPGGKIIQEEQTRALIYLQIEQDRGVSKRAGSEKHLNPSVKIIKPIRMDQLESKASIEPIKVGRQ